MVVVCKKKKKPHPAWVFLRKMPEKQLILFAWPNRVGVRIYIYIYIYICHQKQIVIERTRDLIYLKFGVTDFSLKIISPSAGENSGDSA